MMIATRIIQATRGMSIAEAMLENVFDIPGVVPEYVRPLFCERKEPLRRVALAEDPDDIFVTDQIVLDMFAHDESGMREAHWALGPKPRATMQDRAYPVRK